MTIYLINNMTDWLIDWLAFHAELAGKLLFKQRSFYFLTGPGYNTVKDITIFEKFFPTNLDI